MYYGNQKINKKWNWHTEIQMGCYNFMGNQNQLLPITGIGYHFTADNQNLLIGYAFVNTQSYLSNSDQKTDSNEHRIFQQLSTKQKIGRTTLQHRYRIEERFFKDDFQIRFRYLIGIKAPIHKKSLEKNHFYLSAYDKIFINAENPLFERNRLHGALGYFFHENIKIEAGFMAQTLENSNRNQFQIAIFNNLPL